MTRQEGQERARLVPLTRELADQDLDDLDWCFANAGRFISCVGVTDRRFCDDRGWYERKPDERPQATYTITVTNPGWLAHLVPGMEWGTSGFDDDVWPRIQPAWRSPDVMALAKGIDASQDFSGMPVLADALQEAGCDSDDLLSNLRDPHAVHVRGCWALDLLLGRA